MKYKIAVLIVILVLVIICVGAGIGIGHAIYLHYGSCSIIIRPNGGGGAQLNYCSGGAYCGKYYTCSNQWQMVNEATPDCYATYVEDHLYDSYDLYTLDHPAQIHNQIVSVVVTQVSRAWYCPEQAYDYQGADSWCVNVVETRGQTYYSSAFALEWNTDTSPNGWRTCSTTYTVNPYTQQAWTWDEINALQAGPKLHCQYPTTPWTGTLCTQLYVTVNFRT